MQSFMKRSHIQQDLFDLNVLRNMNIFQLWKILVVDEFRFIRTSPLVPDELKIITGSIDISIILPVKYAQFLADLCHDHINNTLVRHVGNSS